LKDLKRPYGLQRRQTLHCALDETKRLPVGQRRRQESEAPQAQIAKACLSCPARQKFSLGAIINAGIQYGMLHDMETVRKITVEVPRELLEKAQRASGAGITQTVRSGLQLVAASQTYARLRQFRGKVRSSRTLAELKADR
jgi:hypothetical protein